MPINIKRFKNKILKDDESIEQNIEVNNSDGIIDSPDSTNSYGLEKGKGLDVSSIHSVESITVEKLDDEKDWEGDPTYMDNSPYAQVRAVVDATDDPTIRVNHWRTWFLTTIFVIVFSGVNQFFSLRFPSISISSLVCQVISYPIGQLLATLPDWKCSFCPFFDLNPGPFSKKEHAVITISVSLTASTAYAMYILNAQKSFYNMNLNFGYQLLLVWTSQILGYGAAGLTRRFIIYPASSIWPANLISVSLFECLHTREKDNNPVNGWRMPRYTLFMIIFIASFVWYWVPGFLFTGLSGFNVILWGPKTRNNFIANALFGVWSGLGLFPITFDYTQISQAMGSVFATPYWVSANTYAAVIIFFLIILPILYFTNTWYAKFMPLISSSTFDNTQQAFNVSKILNEDFSINFEKYTEYSPVMLPLSYLIGYALSFAATIAIFVHCWLYHRKDIVAKIRDRLHGGADIHTRLYLQNYKECPDSWYLILQIITIGLGFVTVCVFKTHFPVWAFIIALLIAFISFIPNGLLISITNQTVGLNVITEFVCGYMLPMRPMANLLFKLYGYMVMFQGLSFSGDLKLGLYMKIPPRLLFFIQLYSTIIAGIVQVCIQEWMTDNIKGICDREQPDGFSCPDGRVIFNASIIWSLPRYLFSPGTIYNPLLWFFLIGFVTPIIVYLLQKKYKNNEFIQSINVPVFFTGSGTIPPSTPYNFTMFFAMSFVLNEIRKRWPHWYSKYNYVMGAAVEASVAIAGVVIFLCVVYPGGTLNWWGNTVSTNTIDYNAGSYYTLKEGQTYGPSKWW